MEGNGFDKLPKGIINATILGLGGAVVAFVLLWAGLVWVRLDKHDEKIDAVQRGVIRIEAKLSIEHSTDK